MIKKLLLTLLCAVAAISPRAFAQSEGETIPFPVKWSDDTWQTTWKTTGTGAWKATEADHSLGVAGRKTNWQGGIVSTAAIALPAGEDVEINFRYKASCGVTITVYVYDDEGDITSVATDVAQATAYSPHSVKINAERPGTVRFTAVPKISTMSSGSLSITDINIDYPFPNLSATGIAAPSTTLLAAGSNVTLKGGFSNKSVTDATAVTFAYSVDGGEVVRESYPAGLAAGENVDYTFATPLAIPASGTAVLKIWVECDADTDQSNNSFETVITAVAPHAFPFTDTFDNGLEAWAATGDGWKDAKVGEEAVAQIAAGTPMAGNVLWTSPVGIPAGKSRLSFYYASLQGLGTASLKVLGGTTPSLDAMTEIISLGNIANDGWLNAYATFEAPQEEVWYFAIVGEGSSDGIVIDNFNIDRGEDLCMEKVEFLTESGYNIGTARVALTFVNHGLTPQSGIIVGYGVNGIEDMPGETISGTVEPGESYTHIFETESDLSTPGSYTPYGAIITAVGTDTRNDLIAGASITHWPNKEVPYIQKFSGDDAAQWKLTKGEDSKGRWMINNWGANNAYYDTHVLQHTASNSGTVDDWAFSECVEIPAGTYDISFFYRTNLNFETEKYQQKLSLMMGDGRTPEEMTRTIASYENFTVGRPAYRKSITRVVVDEDGKYYFGFHNYSTPNSGACYIDGFAITPVTEGVELPYTSDFENLADEWTTYNTNKKFTPWTLTDTEEGFKVMLTDHNADAAKLKVPEGLLAGPRLAIRAGQTVNVELEYACISDYADLTVQLLGSRVDDPDAYEMIAEFPATAPATTTDTETVAYADGDSEYATVKATIPPFDDDTEYFLGVRSNQPLVLKSTTTKNPEDIYLLKVKSLSADYDNSETGVSELPAGSTLRVYRQGESVVIAGAEGAVTARFYDISGRTLGVFSGNGTSFTIPADAFTGTVIVSIECANGVLP